jgi:hypothetical protein
MMDLTWKWEAIRQVNTRGKFQGAAERPILKRFILSEHSRRDIIIL